MFIAAGLGPAVLSNRSSSECDQVAKLMGDVAIIFQLKDDLLDSKHDSIGVEENEINFVSILGEVETSKRLNQLFQSTMVQIEKLGIDLRFLSDLVKDIYTR